METLQGMQQAQVELAKSLRVMRETQGPTPQSLHEGPVTGNPQSSEQNASPPQFATLSDLTALLERERLS